MKTTTITLPASHFIDESGEVPTSDFLKRPKTNGEDVPSLVMTMQDNGGESGRWLQCAYRGEGIRFANVVRTR